MFFKAAANIQQHMLLPSLLKCMFVARLHNDYSCCNSRNMSGVIVDLIATYCVTHNYASSAVG